MAKSDKSKGKTSATPTKKIFDLTDVKDPSQFRPKRKKAGDYKAVVSSFEAGKSNAGNDQWVFGLQLASDKSAVYPYYIGFDDKQMWKIHALLVACGMPAPKKKVAVDASKFVGKTLGIELEDDEYEGRDKSRAARLFPVSELADDEPVDDDEDDDTEEDDEVDTDSDEEDEDDSDDTDDEDDDDEEESDDDDSDEDESEDEDEEDEDEDDEPEPVKKKSSKKAAKPEPAPKKAAKKVEPKKPAKVEKKAGKKRKSIDIDDL